MRREKAKRELRFLLKREEVNGRVLYKKGERERESAHFADIESSFVTNAFLLAGQRGVGGGVE